MLMSHVAQDSPMFDYVEQMAGRSTPTKPAGPQKSKKQIQLEQAQMELEMQEEELKEGLE